MQVPLNSYAMILVSLACYVGMLKKVTSKTNQFYLISVLLILRLFFFCLTQNLPQKIVQQLFNILRKIVPIVHFVDCL